jgi:uncharacterized damage-inducible protein DinB
MSRLQLAIDQIVFTRNYTLDHLDQTAFEDWFRKPAGGISHIAWQVGHLAIAEYRLSLWRLLGTHPKETDLITEEFVKLFGYGSVPEFDAAKYPAAKEIRAVLDRVHDKVLQELNAMEESEMDQPVLHPHDFAKTKLQALHWCAHHEMLHAGQIGLLRRELGYKPM